jgi:STE24 endopeptidase
MTIPKHKILYMWLFLLLVVVILLSPLPYWLTGIGQSAAGLSAELLHRPDGTPVTSPKAEARHSLTLPMRLQRMIIYPLLLLAFQLSGGATALRSWLERQSLSILSRIGLHDTRLPRGGQRLTGSNLLPILLFILTFNLGLFLLYFPFNFYSGFILGHQFGLSTQTAPAWMSDWTKSVLIALIINGLLWTGFYALMRWLPRRWPIPAGALLLLFSLIFTLLTPILITPLFYNVTPLEDPDLRSRILALTDRAGLEVDRIEVIDASTKTTTVNAYFTGFGGARRIVLYDTLLTGYTPDQTEVVLAHELGHWYYRHVLWSILGYGAAAWLGLFGLRWLLHRVWQPLGLRSPADVAGLPFLLAVISLAGILAMPVENSISRYGEAQADRFALTTSQKPAAFIELFEQFAEQNLAVVDVPAWEKWLFYTHPPIVDRIQMAKAFQQLDKVKSSAIVTFNNF